MKGATQLAEPASAHDPAAGLRAAAALRQLLERLERSEVAVALERGWTWQQIADALGVSRRTVHKIHRASGP